MCKERIAFITSFLILCIAFSFLAFVGSKLLHRRWWLFAFLFRRWSLLSGGSPCALCSCYTTGACTGYYWLPLATTAPLHRCLVARASELWSLSLLRSRWFWWPQIWCHIQKQIHTVIDPYCFDFHQIHQISQKAHGTNNMSKGTAIMNSTQKHCDGDAALFLTQQLFDLPRQNPRSSVFIVHGQCLGAVVVSIQLQHHQKMTEACHWQSHRERRTERKIHTWHPDMSPNWKESLVMFSYTGLHLHSV